jgi:hypothetical protein
MLTISDAPAIRAILDEIGVPADHTVFGMAALGYADPAVPVADKARIGKVAYIE